MSAEISEAIAAMILERQKARVAETAARREKVQDDRTMFKRRRKYGLERRHAEKLARNATGQQIA